MGELMDVLEPALSSAPRTKRHYRGRRLPERQSTVDAFAHNEVILLLNILAYEVVHAGRCLMEAATREGWSLRRFRERVLRAPARIGLTAVLHSWGSALTHHPHVHCIVPDGGISPDGGSWISCRSGFFPPVRVLSRLFRRLVLEKLTAAHVAGRLKFFGDHLHLADAKAFSRYLRPLRKAEWVVYAKRPFAGPEAVLAYLSRYTYRVAIANSRLIALDDKGVTFTWKDYRAKGRDRQKIMTLATPEIIRRFLIHVLPSGFHRIRHYGLFANGGRAENLAQARELLALQARPDVPDQLDECDEPRLLSHPCPCCGGRMIIIETFERGCPPRAPPPSPIGIDSS